MRELFSRVRVAFLFRRIRVDCGIPMRGWWWNIARPYILTGKTPTPEQLGPRWKNYLDAV